ncbi:MAG: acylphosphatase [Betaproteobacteria bacterium]|nr:acylphosphatase [Betaproteobacteria bacterium]
MVTKHLRISGRVQGVGYRNYMEYKARQFNIKGWVRNRSDGSVEAVIQGAPADVDAIILRARRGPPKASVTHVELSDATGDFTGFATRQTE